MFAFGYSPVAKPHMQYTVIAADGVLAHTTAVELPDRRLMHDFAITERFAVFMNHPYTFDVRRWLRGEPIARFQPERGSQARAAAAALLGRRRALVPDRAVLRVPRGERVGRGRASRARRVPPRGPRLRGRDRARKHSRVDGAALALAHRPARRLSTRGAARRPERRAAERPPGARRAPRALRVRLALSQRRAPAARRRALEVRLRKGCESKLHAFGPNRTAARECLSPRPGARDEDDGWLLAFVHDEARTRASYRVADAAPLRGSPVARVLLPQRVPYGLHGLWLRARISRESAYFRPGIGSKYHGLRRDSSLACSGPLREEVPFCPPLTRINGTPLLPRTCPTFSVASAPRSMILSGEARGLEYRLDQPRTAVGRGPGVDLALDDASLRTRHALVEFRGGGFVLRAGRSRERDTQLTRAERRRPLPSRSARAAVHARSARLGPIAARSRAAA